MKGERFMKRETWNFLELLQEHTDMSLDIVMLNHEALINRRAGKRCLIAEGVRISEIYDILVKENMWWKATERNENLYYCWSHKNQSFNIAYVDDIVDQAVDRFIEKNHFMLIQTSQKKHQGLFKLNRSVTAEELLIIQRTLAETYGGDNRATGAFQLKRLAGFRNTKYPDRFMVKVYHVGDRVLSADDVLEYARKKEERERRKAEKKLRELRSQLSNVNQIRTHANKVIHGEVKSWWEFYSGDESVADMKFALHLLRRGFSEQEVREKLLQESQDLFQRKGRYVDDYLDRTISKAMCYIGNLEPQ